MAKITKPGVGGKHLPLLEGAKWEEGKPILVPITIDDLIDQFDEADKPRLVKLFHDKDVDAVVLFVNDNPDSVEFGSKSAVKIGPTQKIRTVNECLGKFVGAHPHQKVALFYCLRSGGSLEINQNKLDRASRAAERTSMQEVRDLVSEIHHNNHHTVEDAKSDDDNHADRDNHRYRSRPAATTVPTAVSAEDRGDAGDTAGSPGDDAASKDRTGEQEQ